jgi:hypothetical protein
LVLPPRVAPLQVVVVTIPNSKLSAEDAKKLNGAYLYPLTLSFLLSTLVWLPSHRSRFFVSLGSAS